MIFVTVGSQKFQFNRLLKKLDNLIEEKVIQEELFAQTGYSDYKPENYDYKPFLDHAEFNQYIDKCDMVITHGGTGVIISAIKDGKKVIAVPRLAKYGEHVDDHQLQLLEQFGEMNLIETCVDIENLADCYNCALKTTYNKYQSNTQTIIGDIESYIASLKNDKS